MQAGEWIAFREDVAAYPTRKPADTLSGRGSANDVGRTNGWSPEVEIRMVEA
jgi:hypothetical protein